MRYKIVKGLELIKEIFEKMKDDTLVTSSYLGKTVSNVCGDKFGIIYDQERGEIITMGKEDKGLIKKFNELTLSKGVVSESI